MFAKVNETMTVNMLHVTEVRIFPDGNLRVFMDDNQTAYDVTGELAKAMKHSMERYNQVLRRLALGDL